MIITCALLYMVLSILTETSIDQANAEQDRTPLFFPRSVPTNSYYSKINFADTKSNISVVALPGVYIACMTD